MQKQVQKNSFCLSSFGGSLISICPSFSAPSIKVNGFNFKSLSQIRLAYVINYNVSRFNKNSVKTEQIVELISIYPHQSFFLFFPAKESVHILLDIYLSILIFGTIAYSLLNLHYLFFITT